MTPTNTTLPESMQKTENLRKPMQLSEVQQFRDKFLTGAKEDQSHDKLYEAVLEPLTVADMEGFIEHIIALQQSAHDRLIKLEREKIKDIVRKCLIEKDFLSVGLGEELEGILEWEESLDSQSKGEQ